MSKRREQLYHGRGLANQEPQIRAVKLDPQPAPIVGPAPQQLLPASILLLNPSSSPWFRPQPVSSVQVLAPPLPSPATAVRFRLRGPSSLPRRLLTLTGSPSASTPRPECHTSFHRSFTRPCHPRAQLKPHNCVWRPRSPTHHSQRPSRAHHTVSRPHPTPLHPRQGSLRRQLSHHTDTPSPTRPS